MRLWGSTVVHLPLVALLAGCGGLGLGGGDDDGAGAFDSLEAQGDALLDEVEGLSYSDPSALPTSGAATYSGVVGLDIDSVPNETLQGQDIVGELELTVNFAPAGDAVTGRAGGFVDQSNESWAGTLIIDDGAIDRSADPTLAPTFTADMAGVLTAGDGTAWTVDTDLAGDFAGDDHSHALGDADGSACSAGGCSGIEGSFVAAR